MSTADVITEVSSALSNAAPYAGAITALAELGIDITALIKPTEVDYDQQYQDQLKQAADLVSALVAHPDADTERALGAFDDELLVATGRPLVGGLSTERVAIRVDRLLAHIADSAELVLYKQLFAQLNAAKQSPGQQAPVTSPTPKGSAA